MSPHILTMTGDVTIFLASGVQCDNLGYHLALALLQKGISFHSSLKRLPIFCFMRNYYELSFQVFQDELQFSN